MSTDPREITLLLPAVRAHDPAACARLFELVYAELRGLASAYGRGLAPGRTLQPTAVVHEAFVKLVESEAGWKDRAHFMAIAATAMRQVVADHARARGAQKRGGELERVTLDEASALVAGCDLDLVALDEALELLRAADPRKHRVVELRFFGGLTVDEVAEVEGLSTSTIEAEWRAARAWLGARLAPRA